MLHQTCVPNRRSGTTSHSGIIWACLTKPKKNSFANTQILLSLWFPTCRVPAGINPNPSTPPPLHPPPPPTPTHRPPSPHRSSTSAISSSDSAALAFSAAAKAGSRRIIEVLGPVRWPHIFQRFYVLGSWGLWQGCMNLTMPREQWVWVLLRWLGREEQGGVGEEQVGRGDVRNGE